MEGEKDNYGVCYKTFDILFKERKNRTDYNINYKMYMVEIYNENVRDLLDNLKNLDIRQNSNGMIYIPNVLKKDINNYSEVTEIIKEGNNIRSTNSTNSNEHSSRSHMLTFIEIDSENKYSLKHIISNLVLVYILLLLG